MTEELKAKYPKHLIQIQDIIFDFGDNINPEYDINQTFSKLNFDFPYITDYSALILTEDGTFSNSTVDTTKFQKYDLVKLYYATFDTQEQANQATINDMTLIFNGYIQDPHLTQGQSGYNYSLSCYSTMGLAYERTTTTKIFSSNIDTIMNIIFSETDLGLYVPGYDIDNNISTNLIFDIDADFSAGKVLDSIRTKYAVQIYQRQDGRLQIKFPGYLFTGTTTVSHDYDPNTNTYDIDYGNLGNAFDTVICIGLNSFGIAFDPVAYQLKRGIPSSEIADNPAIDKTELTIFYIERRDIAGDEACQEVARNKLVDMAKNYTISIKTQYIPEQNLGDFIRIINSTIIPESQLWLIKNIQVSIDSQTSTLTCYTSSISDFPDDILLPADGILDVDILQQREKENQGFNL